MGREDHMSFEEVGRAVDLELENLKKWLNREVKPSTRQEMADGLRKISEHLAELADRLHKPPKR